MAISVYRYNNSIDENYYKQTNNLRDPQAACFPTSMINGGSVINVKFPNYRGAYERDDQYDAFLHDNDAIIKWASSRGFKTTKTIDIREYWEVEEYAFNYWVQERACHIDWDLTKEKLLETLLAGGAVVTSGIFASYKHVVTIVGFESVEKDSSNADALRTIIVDDSYGNPHNRYRPVGVNGNNVPFDCDEFWNCTEKDKKRHYGIIFTAKSGNTKRPATIHMLPSHIEHSVIMPGKPNGIPNW